MSNEQTAEKRETSADIKKQIEAKKEELKNSGLPLTGQRANEINASESTTTNAPIAESKPELPSGAAKSVEGAKTTEENVDLKEWGRKKGIDWTTEESVLSALRKSDQAFAEKRQREKAGEATQRPPAPVYQPPQYAPPAYAPPPVPNPVAIQNIAREYNMPPEDAERLLRFNRDFFEVASRAEREEFARKLNAMEIENKKNSVFRELSADPVFRRPEVAMEYHNVLEQMQGSDPRSFEQDPTAYKRAFDIALSNIGRRNLEGRPLAEGVTPPARQVLPTNPPRAMGNGSGGGALENENGIDPATFAKLSLAEKSKLLEKMGLKAAY
jgi:hypothetical protein